MAELCQQAELLTQAFKQDCQQLGDIMAAFGQHDQQQLVQQVHAHVLQCGHERQTA